MATIQVPITKGGKDAFIAVNTDDPKDGGDLPEEMFQEALKLGLKAMLNRGMDKIQVAKLEGDKLKDAQAAALAKAQANFEAVKAGTVRKSAKGAKVSGVLNTEALRIARNLIKDKLKADGYKVSYYPAAEITIAAKALIEANPAILDMAKANLEARDAASKTIGDALTVIAKSAKQSDKLIKAVEDKKAEAKANKPLSAKQAGKTKKHIPAKPASQPQTTAH